MIQERGSPRAHRAHQIHSCVSKTYLSPVLGYFPVVAHLSLQERDGPVALGNDLDLFGVRGALGQAEERGLLVFAVYVVDLHPGYGRRSFLKTGGVGAVTS